MKEFNLDPLFVPTVVGYSPKKQRFANMIGGFSVENIKSFARGLLYGKAKTLQIKEDYPEFKENKCDEIQLASETTGEIDEELEKEILKEILEEEEKKKKIEAENEENEKKKKKKGKKKKKKRKTDL